VTGALGDCCAGGCPLSIDLGPLPLVGLDLALLLLTRPDLAPLRLAELENLGLVLLKATALVHV